MSADFDELRARIAAEHHVLVGPDDPILMLVTAQEFCLQRSLQLIESAHAQALALQSQQLELAAQRWLTAAQTASQHLLDRSASDIQAAAATAAAGVQDAVAESVRALVGPLRTAIVVSLCGSLLSLIACALLWLR
jgi:hypothetical protein